MQFWMIKAIAIIANIQIMTMDSRTDDSGDSMRALRPRFFAGFFHHVARNKPQGASAAVKETSEVSETSEVRPLFLFPLGCRFGFGLRFLGTSFLCGRGFLCLRCGLSGRSFLRLRRFFLGLRDAYVTIRAPADAEGGDFFAGLQFDDDIAF